MQLRRNFTKPIYNRSITDDISPERAPPANKNKKVYSHFFRRSVGSFIPESLIFYTLCQY